MIYVKWQNQKIYWWYAEENLLLDQKKYMKISSK